MRDNAKVLGRWPDNRRNLVTEFAGSGAGDEVTMSIAGRVSRAVHSPSSNVRMERRGVIAESADCGETAGLWRANRLLLSTAHQA